MTEVSGRGTPRVDLGELIEVTHAAVLRATESQKLAAGQTPAGILRGPIIIGIIYNPQLAELGQANVVGQGGGR